MGIDEHENKAPTYNRIQCGISQAFDEGTIKPGFTTAAYGSSFVQTETDITALAPHILAGGAWIPGQFKGTTRKNETFICTITVALDFDHTVSVADLLAVPLVREYAAIIHPTKSSGIISEKNPDGGHRSRLVFVLDKPIYGVEPTRAIIRAIAEHIGLEYDPASYKPAQPFFGSRNTIEIPHINRFAVLPLELAAGLTADLAREDYRRYQDSLIKQQTRKPVDLNSTRAEKYTAATWEGILRTVASAPDGTKNNALFKGACDGFAIVDWPGMSVGKIEADLESIYGAWPNAHKSRGTVASARRTATPRELILDEKHSPANREGRANNRINGVETVLKGAKKVSYVSDDLTPAVIAAERSLLITAPVGMGKTRAIADYAASLPADDTLTGVAQFRLLTLALNVALKSLHYKDLDTKDQTLLGSSPRLVSSVSSLYKFQRAPGVVIADEIEGVLQFILNSGTFEGNEAVIAFQALRNLVTNAVQFIGMDAGLSSITENLIRQWRGNITVKRYTSGRKLRKVSFLRDKHAAFWTVGKMLRSGRGAVYAACTSETDASDLADLYAGADYRILKITRDTSNTDKVQAFIKNEHDERAAYDLVIYTSAAGAGVDFSNPIYALVGIFGKQPLAPEQAIQLFGRVRNARRYYAAVPPMNEPYPTPSAEKLLSDRLRREMWTARQNGIESAGGDYLEILKLWSEYHARALKESAQWRKYFAQRLQDNGFSVQVNNARAPIAFVEQVKQWRVERSESDWQFIQDATGQALPDEAIDKLRTVGQEITHDLKLRNLRAKIEAVLQHEHVTTDDRDLTAYRGRKRLSWLADLFTDSADLMTSDRAQSLEGVPLQKRKYRALNIGIVTELLKLARFEGQTPEARLMAFVEYFGTEHPTDELNERFAPWITSAGLRKFEALGHRDTNAHTARGLCRFFCDLFGLDLESIRRGRADGRYRAYQLNAETTAYRIERARRAASLRQEIACTQNMYIRAKHILGTSDKSTFDTLFPAAKVGKPPAPLPDSAKAAALLDALRKENHFGNPFSKQAAA